VHLAQRDHAACLRTCMGGPEVDVVVSGDLARVPHHEQSVVQPQLSKRGAGSISSVLQWAPEDVLMVSFQRPQGTVSAEAGAV